jgi:hypothetical protein
LLSLILSSLLAISVLSLVVITTDNRKAFFWQIKVRL